ncbi:MAG TPA: Co2+/Mg2+ efflux protein ApaG [Flavobacteriales bacterium]|nr:Co2+/Mg2+ efflux protein ApaG [Flavobacteriales bacterium]
MSVKVSQGIKIKVETNYLSEYSKPAVNHFLFSYRITIENQNPFAVQLLRRHWFIKDTATSMRQVEGEGVVGQMPIIEPGTNYTYESGCNLTSDMGSMRGTYKFLRVDDDSVFEAEIPEFNLTAPWKSN